MKKITLTLLCSVFLLSVYGQKEIRDVKSFDKITAFGNLKIELKKGNKEKVIIESDDVNTEDITTEVKDLKLEIRMTANLFEKDDEAKITITFKELREIKAHAGVNVFLRETLEADKLTVIATSGGYIEMLVNLNAVRTETSQGGHIDLRGNAKIQESLSIAGGILTASELQCDEVYIKMNTGGQADVVANKLLNAKVSSGASLTYYGNPEKQDLSTILGGRISSWDKE